MCVYVGSDFTGGVGCYSSDVLVVLGCCAVWCMPVLFCLVVGVCLRLRGSFTLAC